MECPKCKFDNPPLTDRCTKCGTPLEADGTSFDASLPGHSPAPGVTPEPRSTARFQVGSTLAGRYEILQLLGEGGMGAVYKARDRELDRVVAIKVIHPDLVGRPEVIHRFKQEIILARTVTHQNVNRIFDLGETNGIKFITMEYVEGQDLKTLLRAQGKYPPEEAAEIIRQTCRALGAAHAKGVVHRDLKPSNIAVDKEGTVTVMDFGIAHSMELTGLTQTGMLLGTPEYMSPEQAKGEKVDPRSDLFALGLIFYELLTGKVPYKADTTFGTLIKRTQERTAPPSKIVPGIPQFISDVVVKCLEIDPKDRYQSAREILADLEARRGPRTHATIAFHPPALHLPGRPRTRIALGLVLLLLVVAGFVFRKQLVFWKADEGGAPGQVISLAILPFRNASGNSALDWLGPSLAEMLSTDVGQSSHLQTVSPDRLHQILRDLRVPADARYDSQTLSRLADFTSADKLVWGQYVKVGDQVRIDAKLQDMRREQTIALSAEAPSEDDLLSAVEQLARSIRENLTLSASQVDELRAAAFVPTSKSVEALREYSQGLELARQGKQLDALKQFQAAIQRDPEFALAHSRLALTYSSLGYDEKAEEASQKAIELSDPLPAPERYRILAAGARIENDPQKAIETYENLAKISPNDQDVQFNLATLYQATGRFPQARGLFSRILANNAKYVAALVGMARVELAGGDPQNGLDYLNRALSLAVQLDNNEQKATILSGIGVAYDMLNKPEDALRNYEQALDIRRRLGDQRGIGLALDSMAQVQDLLGKSDEALKSYQEALEIRRQIGDKRGIGDTLINLGTFYESRGEYDRAMDLTKESLQIQREIGDPTYEALCLNNIGWIYLDKGAYDDALTYLEQALLLRQKLNVPADIANTLHSLAETYMGLGRYEQALENYLRSLELWRKVGDRRGIALTSYGMGILFQYQGRFGAALSAEKEALDNFRALQEQGLWLAQILRGYGSALSLVGRDDEADKSLEEALGLARKVGNDSLVVKILNSQGDSSFYRGDFKAAQAFYDQALQLASRTKDRRLILISQLNQEKTAVKEGRSAAALRKLREIAGEAEAAKMTYQKIECSIYLGEALTSARNYAQARQELQGALRESRNLGLKALQAQASYLLGNAQQSLGQTAEASRNHAEARRLLDEIRREAGSDQLIKRSDLAPIIVESSKAG